MRHFPSSTWIDFVRETADPKQAMAVRDHVQTNCPECLKAEEIWRRVVNFTGNESRYDPPQATLRAVKATFALYKVMEVPVQNFTLASLVFDSEAQGPLAGTRGSVACARQLLFQSGSVCIDVQVQPKPMSNDVVLVGQVLDSTKTTQEMGNIPVSLISGADALSRATTNDFGEFEFGFGLLQRVQLIVGIEGRGTIVVPVPNTSKFESGDD